MKQSPTEKAKCVGVCGKLGVIVETKSNKCSDLKQSNREKRRKRKERSKEKIIGRNKEITKKKEIFI